MPNKQLDTKIEDLFKWKGELEVKDNKGEAVETLYQRVIGDADVDKARTKALKESRLLRRKLNNPESDEALAHLPFKGEHDKEELISLTSMARYQDFRSRAALNTDERRVKPPGDDATLEEQEQYIEDLEKARQDYEDSISDKVRKYSEEYKKELRKLDLDDIFDSYIKYYIDLLCQRRMIEVFNTYSAFYGTYKDKEYKERRFNTYDDFLNISTQVKDDIIENYRRLTLGLDEIKK